MNVLILFEQSGICNQAFTDMGNHVLSVDICANHKPGLNHIIDDAMKHLKRHKDFDLLLAFPPCTMMSSASGRRFMQPGFELRQLQAAQTFFKIWTSKYKYIAIENPRGHLEKFINASQEIHPYYFGDPYQKRTRLF